MMKILFLLPVVFCFLNNAQAAPCRGGGMHRRPAPHCGGGHKPKMRFFYQYSSARKQWEIASKLVDNQLYLHYDDARRGWAWITPKDFRPLAEKSKVQWKRIERLGTNAELDWYRLGSDGLTWKRVTDRERPAIYRREANGGTVVSELYPENWMGLGGTIDASNKLGCVLTPEPRSVEVSQPITLHITLQGVVSDVVVGDTHLPIHLERNPAFSETTITPVAPGFFTASATVSGPDGKFVCEAPYDVRPKP